MDKNIMKCFVLYKEDKIDTGTVLLWTEKIIMRAGKLRRLFMRSCSLSRFNFIFISFHFSDIQTLRVDLPKFNDFKRFWTRLIKLSMNDTSRPTAFRSGTQAIMDFTLQYLRPFGMSNMITIDGQIGVLTRI